MEERKSSPRLDTLQALRGFAVLAVAFGHAVLRRDLVEPIALGGGAFGWGWIGVDVFFSLSGFVIMWVHGGDLGLPERAAPFAWKRFIRVYPPYLLVLLFVAAASFLAARHGYQTLDRLPAPVTRPGAFLQSLALLPPYDLLIVGVAWTLVHEVLFYALFFAAIVLGLQTARVGVLLWTALILLYPHPDGGTASLTCDIVFSPYNLEFLAGVIAAWAIRRSPGVVPPGIGIASPWRSS